jgi:hypothetical protein
MIYYSISSQEAHHSENEHGIHFMYSMRIQGIDQISKKTGILLPGRAWAEQIDRCRYVVGELEADCRHREVWNDAKTSICLIGSILRKYTTLPLDLHVAT